MESIVGVYLELVSHLATDQHYSQEITDQLLQVLEPIEDLKPEILEGLKRVCLHAVANWNDGPTVRRHNESSRGKDIPWVDLRGIEGLAFFVAKRETSDIDLQQEKL